MHKHVVLLNDKTIIKLNFAKYRDLSVSCRSIICLCLRHRQIIDLLSTDKSRYFAQPRPIIVYYYHRISNTIEMINRKRPVETLLLFSERTRIPE